MARVCVKIMQVFVKLSKFFRQITTKTGNFKTKQGQSVAYPLA
jgi:hypothetical protein